MSPHTVGLNPQPLLTTLPSSTIFKTNGGENQRKQKPHVIPPFPALPCFSPFVTANFQPFNPGYAFKVPADSTQFKLTVMYIGEWQQDAGSGYKHICFMSVV